MYLVSRLTISGPLAKIYYCGVEIRCRECIMRSNGSYALGGGCSSKGFLQCSKILKKYSLCGVGDTEGAVENLFPNILGNRFTALENR
jgi:hypothetical protein